MIQAQELAGMRPQDIRNMRTGDIDMTGDVWVYKPWTHKTEHFPADVFFRRSSGFKKGRSRSTEDFGADGYQSSDPPNVPSCASTVCTPTRRRSCRCRRSACS